MATISGQIVTRAGSYREQIWGAWFFMVLSTGLMIILDDHSNQLGDPIRFSVPCIVLNDFTSLGPNKSYSCCLAHLEPAHFSRRA